MTTAMPQPAGVPGPLMSRPLRRLLVVAGTTVALAAGSTSGVRAAEPLTTPASPFAQLAVPPDPPGSLFEDRMVAELTATYGADFVDATVRSIRCGAGAESSDRYTGLRRVCPYEFGSRRVRWSGAITFSSDTSPATTYLYARPNAKPYGLRERYCRPNRTWTLRKTWRISRLTASRRASDVPGCTDAIDVLRHLTVRGTTRRVPRSAFVGNAYSMYGPGFGEDSGPWTCDTTGTRSRPMVSCRGRFDRTFTATLRSAS